VDSKYKYVSGVKGEHGRGVYFGSEVCVSVGGAGGGSGRSLSHMSVYSGVSRQLPSGECQHISAFCVSLLSLLYFSQCCVTPASLCASISLSRMPFDPSKLIFGSRRAVTCAEDFFDAVV